MKSIVTLLVLVACSALLLGRYYWHPASPDGMSTPTKPSEQHFFSSPPVERAFGTVAKRTTTHDDATPAYWVLAIGYLFAFYLMAGNGTLGPYLFECAERARFFIAPAFILWAVIWGNNRERASVSDAAN